MPFEYLIWKMAMDTGWTLEYIRNLPYGEMIEYLEIVDAQNKAKNT